MSTRNKEEICEYINRFTHNMSGGTIRCGSKRELCLVLNKYHARGTDCFDIAMYYALDVIEVSRLPSSTVLIYDKIGNLVKAIQLPELREVPGRVFG